MKNARIPVDFYRKGDSAKDREVFRRPRGDSRGRVMCRALGRRQSQLDSMSGGTETVAVDNIRASAPGRQWRAMEMGCFGMCNRYIGVMVGWAAGSQRQHTQHRHKHNGAR